MTRLTTTETTYARRLDRGVEPYGDATVVAAKTWRTSWGAILAGALAATGLQILFTILGVAIGVTAADVGAGGIAERAAEGIGLGGAIWWTITGTISLFLGGMVTGRLAGLVKGVDVHLHSFTMWCVTALLGVVMIWSGAGMAATATAAAGAGFGARQGWYSPSGNSGASAPIVLDNPVVQSDQNTGTTAARDAQATAEQIQDYAQAASWWTLIAFLLGIAASLIGGWLAAPTRLVLTSPANPPVHERDRDPDNRRD